MTETTGPLTSLADLIAVITERREAWQAFSSFAETVMRGKRALESAAQAREREQDSSASSGVSEVKHLYLAIREDRRRADAAPFRLPSSSGSGQD